MEVAVIILLTIISPGWGLMISLIGVLSGKKWKFHILLLSYVLAVMAYNYIPTVESDLVRYFDLVKTYGNYSFAEIVTLFINGRQYFIGFSALCWFISKLGNVHFLPAIVVFFVYIITFYITYKFAEDNRISMRCAFRYVCLIFLALSFYNVTNNIRNILAFSIIGLAVFRDVYQGKRDIITIALYVIPIFLHSTALVLVLLRLVLKLAGKLKTVAVVLVVFAAPILGISQTLLKHMNHNSISYYYVRIFIEKGIGYFTHSDAEWAIVSSKSGSMFMTKIMYILLIVVFTYFILYVTIEKVKLESGKDFNGYISFVFYVCLMTFACIPMVMPEYWRFASLVLVMGGPIFLTLDQHQMIKVLKINATNILYLIALCCFILWARDMWLYSDVLNMITNTLLFNPFFKMLG